MKIEPIAMRIAPSLAERDAVHRKPSQSTARQILEVIDRYRPRLVTLDVFDTAVWRPCRTPSDLFEVIGEDFQRRGWLRYGVGAAQFAQARRHAERQARIDAAAQLKSSEIGLRDVYARLMPLMKDCTAQGLVEAEVAIEASLLQPDLSIMRVLEGLRARRVPYAFVSDTYFTARELRQLLARIDTSTNERAFLSSHEEQLDKASGLIVVAAARFGVSPSEILHIGDNVHADVAGAKRVEAAHLHLPQFRDIAPTVFQGEEEIATLLGSSWQHSPVRCGVDAIRKQVWHEVMGVERASDLTDQLGLLTVGPLLAGFAEWVVKEAEAAGIGTLLCLTREGLLLAELINEFASKAKSDVRAIPFLTSRAVTYPTLFREVDVPELEAYFFSRRTPLTASRFMQRIGANIDDCPSLPLALRHLSVRRDDPLGRTVLEHLAGSTAVRAAVLLWASNVKAQLTRYIRRVVQSHALAPNTAVAFVDLGWTTRSQTVLQNAIADIGGLDERLGLYLATDEAAAAETAKGTLSRGFLFDMGEPAGQSRVTLRCKEILEQVCSADVGSVSGFDDEGSPIFDAAAPDVEQQRFLAKLRGRVRDFCTTYMDMRGACVAAENSELSRMAPALRMLLARLTVRPLAQEVSLIGAWVHDENNGSSAREIICDPYAAELVRYATARQVHALPLYWVFGLLHTVRPGVFNSVVAQSMGAQLSGDDEEQLARMHVMHANAVVEDLPADYYFGNDGVGISYVVFHHAGPLTLRWLNHGTRADVLVERVLLARRHARTGNLMREVLRPADVFRGGTAAGEALRVANGAFLEYTLPLEPDPWETSVVLCLRRT